MIRAALKPCIRALLGMSKGPTLGVMAGPLKGRRLLRQHGLPNLSMLFGKYEEAFASAFLRYLPDADVVYDIGAHSGYFSLLAANSLGNRGTVHAFEPAPDVVEDCRRLFQSNHLSVAVNVNEMALSDEEGTVRMVTPASSTTGIIEAAVRHSTVPQESAVDVAATTLDQYVYRDGNAVPDVIKVDVEGAEAHVLRGASRVLSEARPTILMEVHGRKPAADVWNAVMPHDYEVRLLNGAHENSVSEQQWAEEFGSSNWKIQHCVLVPRQRRAA